MHEQHTGRAADRAGAMAATTDVVGKEHVAAAALVLLPVAGFDFESAGKHEQKLTPRGWMPILIEAPGHFRHHRALRRQDRGAMDGVAESVGRRIADWDIDLDKLRSAIGRRSKADDSHHDSPNSAPSGAGLAIYQAAVPASGTGCATEGEGVEMKLGVALPVIDVAIGSDPGAI